MVSDADDVDSLRKLIRAGPSRGLDFVKLDELNRRTGIEAKDALSFALSELLCNALDKHDATEIKVDMQVARDFEVLTVSDNGKRTFKRSDLELVVDFENKASSKRGFMQVSRGILGNALKCIFGYSFALAESRGLAPQPMTISSGPATYKISIKPNLIGKVIESEIIETQREDDGFTHVSVFFPAEGKRDLSEYAKELKSKIIKGTGYVNPTRRISFNLYGDKDTIGTALEGNEIRQETSALWYTSKQFTELFEDYLTTSPDTQLKTFLAMFRGFSRKAAIRDILQGINDGSNVDTKSSLLPSSPLRDIKSLQIKRLFEVMKEKSKPISKRSVPSVLGSVGKESFERLRQQHEWPNLRYVCMSGFKRFCPECFYGEISKPCKNPDHTVFPYLVELAIFDRDDLEGLELYQAVNFMASSRDVFLRMFDVNYRLGAVGIASSSSVTVIIHVVTPVSPWLNYGKTSLGNIDSCQLMEQAFDKLLPIPKTPREYHPPPPARPLSWIPRGNFYDETYRQRLKLFADEINAIVRISAFHIMPKMRGWGYRCEQLGKIDKGEFNALAHAINDCRKLKLLKMDIIRPDPDESRHFRGIHRAASPKTLLEQLRSDVREILDSLPSNVTDFYKDEKFYLIMVVEKSEIFDVFGPICEDYHIPHVSSKGWSNLEIRANIAEQCKWAVAHGLKPVLLLFYDHDPKGLKISERFRRHLKDMEKATGWNPDTMEIVRFGLNKDQIDKYELSWVSNLKTSTGKEAKKTKDVLEYIRQFGEKKCEMESLFKDDKTVRDAEQICREAIEHYLGKDAVERFRNKEEQSKAKLETVYDSPLLKQFDEELTRIEQTLPEEATTEPMAMLEAEKEIEVLVSDDKYGKCPKCHTLFNDTVVETGKLVRCRNCNAPLRLVRISMKERIKMFSLFSTRLLPLNEIAAQFKISEQQVWDIVHDLMENTSDGEEKPCETDDKEDPDNEKASE